MFCLTVVLGIKIDARNLPPDSERRFTVTKFHGFSCGLPMTVKTPPLMEKNKNIVIDPNDAGGSSSVSSSTSSVLQYDGGSLPLVGTHECGLPANPFPLPCVIPSSPENLSSSVVLVCFPSYLF